MIDIVQAAVNKVILLSSLKRVMTTAGQEMINKQRKMIKQRKMKRKKVCLEKFSVKTSRLRLRRYQREKLSEKGEKLKN